MKGARILIAGAGALGSLFGACLRRAGHDVTLLGRRSHLDAIAAGGLHLEGIWGEHEVRGFGLATSADDVRGPFDLAIFAVKAYDVADTARSLAGIVAGNLLSVQNGLGSLEALAQVFGKERVLGAPVLIGASIPALGRVRVTVYAKPVKLGAPWGSHSDAERWAVALAEAGIPSEATDRLLPYLWEKVLYNAPLNPLGALLGVPYGSLANHPDSRAVMDDVIDEGYAVATAENVDLLWPTAAECRRHFYEVLMPPTAHHRSSMLQDLERGRRTEIDALNGYISIHGAALAIATPANALLTRLVKFAETKKAETAGEPLLK